MNVPLLGVSALFYLALLSFFYLLALGCVAAYRTLAGRLAPPSRTKRVMLVGLVVPPVAALLPTVAGVVLRHLHGSGAMALSASKGSLPAEAATVGAHHAMACALIFERITALANFGANAQITSLILGVGAWLLFAAGTLWVARLVWATYRLETGIAPLLSAPSPRLADSLGRVGKRLGIPASLNCRFFECALPPERSSVMGLARVKCVLSCEFVEAAPPEEVDALVSHEAGHLRSGDAYSAFAVGVLNCLFFFLRPVRVLGKWWREAAELAADDTAVRGTGGDPLAVASAILRVRSATVAASPLPAPLLPFADEGALSAEKRVERLLAQAERATPPARTETLAQVAFSWGVTVLFAVLGAGLLVSSEAACVAHCTLELLKNVL